MRVKSDFFESIKQKRDKTPPCIPNNKKKNNLLG